MKARRTPEPGGLFAAAGLDRDAPRPLADRLRPKTLSEVVGQDHLLAPEGPIGRMVARGLPHLHSLRLGALTAAEVIQHVGARPQVNLKALAQENGLL